ncbi:hypothetical protein GMRT_12260 [Giardia muris]|uniref:Uncharacterized protein n=1 Tax=Giardia muris TaxID=5742 RepID=A0A4Z1SY03_GIAMU|nr:hypothetical protein GMRT_12260 [Giardia muris]|eukprot:TNJ30584.1 hypothetical protein GMRT_12260 [Giardia muris]
METTRPAALNAKAHGCGYQGGPCVCAQCITLPQISHKCIPFQQHLYTHRIRTNVHRTPTNYRHMMLTSAPLALEGGTLGEPSQALADSQVTNAHIQEYIPMESDIASSQYEPVRSEEGTARQGQTELSFAPKTELASTINGVALTPPGTLDKNGGTILNPKDFEYVPPKSRSIRRSGTQTRTASAQYSHMEPPIHFDTPGSVECDGPGSDGRLEASQTGGSYQGHLQRSIPLSDTRPAPLPRDGTTSGPWKFQPNVSLLKYPTYKNHMEENFKPGYSEWRHANMGMPRREVYTAPVPQRRVPTEAERLEQRAREAKDMRVMRNMFASGMHTFKASTLPLNRTLVDYNDVSGQRAQAEYLPTISTACRMPSCAGRGCPGQ